MTDRIEDNPEIKPFQFLVSEENLENIMHRVAHFPWHAMPDDGGWDYGTNFDYLKELGADWVNEFDWSAQEARINSFSNFKAKVDGIDMHFIFEKGSGKNPTPLLISHGWPGSVSEFYDLIEPLAHPERFGGNVEDAFTVIVPSLPGFGFSGRPPRPYGPRKMASVLNTLMTDTLGYDKYLAQGGDWGGAICSWLGYDHAKACTGIHINVLTMRHPDGPQTVEEKAWEAQFDNDQIIQDGYRTQQATKPQTLSYAMIDSPVGIAAWIIEKMHGWSDLKDNNIESVYSKDVLLANIMVYVLTNTFNTASWIYFGRREEGGRYFPKDFKQIAIPTGIAIFPKEMSEWPPKSYIERIFNVKQMSNIIEGGHFAALEKPRLLIDDIRKFFAKLR